jgi:ketosteroid isomerase-like protein
VEDEETVILANARFYEAINLGSLSLMESLWVHDERVKCVHPGWNILEGWEQIKNSWSMIFTHGAPINVEPIGAQAEVQGDIAWVTCLERITHRTMGQVVLGAAQTTNIFERVGDKWLMILHHASPIPVQGLIRERLQ